jgi:hypothetical protein
MPGSLTGAVRWGAVDQNVLPRKDNSYNLGNAGKRWALIRGVTITPGDIAFLELTCEICDTAFAQGDLIALVVKAIGPVDPDDPDDTDHTICVPAHAQCPE